MPKTKVLPSALGGSEGSVAGSAPLTASPESTTPWTRELLVDQIVAECAAAGITACDKPRAGRLIDLYTKAAAEIRVSPFGHYRPTTKEMQDLHNNGIMDAITPDMVDGKVPDFAPGSAYAGIAAMTLGPDGLTIAHTKVYDHGTHCALVLGMQFI